MRTVLLASLRTYGRRYGAALLAVAIGVTFVVVTATLSSSVRSGLVAGLEEPFVGADVVVEKPSGEEAARLLDAADRAGAEAWLVAWSVQQVTLEGRMLDAQADVGQVPDAPRHRWQELEAGRFPDRAGEALADASSAEAAGVRIGDTIRVGSGTDAVAVEVVGLADSPSTFSAASVYLLWEDLRRWQDELNVPGVAWADPGDAHTAEATVRDVLPHAEVTEAGAFVRELHTEVNRSVDIGAIVALLFGAIALLVAALVINNTFAILFAQRTRDLALLRCVGAGRRQILRAVRGEALAIGVLSAGLGLLAGTAIGYGVVALVRSQWPGARLGEVSPSPVWLGGAAALGIVVTVVSAWLPTRRVVHVSPLAALRPDDSTAPGTAIGRARLAAGVLAVATGVGLLGVAVATTTASVLTVGGGLTFAGVVVLGPVLVPALLRAAGRPAGAMLGAAGRLAGANAVRNPRRTAATASSLLVGVTLTTAVLAGMASSRAAINGEMAIQHPIDVAITTAQPVPAGVLTQLGRLHGVAGTVALPGTTGVVGPLDDYPLLAVDRSAAPVIRGARMRMPRAGQVVVPSEALGDGLAAGRRVTVAVGGREVTLRVVGGEGYGEAALVAPATLAALDPTAPTRAVWLRAGAGADADDLAAAAEALTIPLGGQLEDGLARREYVDLQLDVVVGGVVGLLGIAVLIALVGIANTLGLSVLERGREHALLRALGLTRRQLRRMLATEAVLLSVVATLLGTVLGTGFAWAAVQALVQPIVPTADLVLPAGQLALVAAVSAVAGLLAAVLPSRRAARVTPAAGLALD